MYKLDMYSMSCRGVPVPFASKFRKERITAIGEEIAKGQHDIVLLQEVRRLCKEKNVFLIVQMTINFTTNLRCLCCLFLQI